MNENSGDDDHGWFEGVGRGDLDAARNAIESGSAEAPADWPERAVGTGFAEDEDDYYEALHEATVYATREEVRERELSDDKQLIHSIRAMADCERTANELAERVAEWGGSRHGESGSGVEYARELAERAPENRGDEALQSLAERTVGLADEADELRTFIERTAPAVAPNLSALAGPVLAARLISLAGGLEPLAKQPSGTVQVLGAEDALFAHLKGNAPSPKHGIIFTHEYVSGTRREERGSAARALAGKLSIAARVDHYSGERKPELDAELDERIERIRSRGGDAE
ncbi:NOP5/NOP56 family protein [Haloarcula nitratireducens]|uniref:NOP58 family protein n=1 Tax=Haloarcula nitratireducens TaxID=2487749 RepID=A0AAW4P7N4_9EURY|nr:NOP5/NOP56 family protein [Halomicroarcula nitratireducens]MBX0293904.1 NOP58 family protein [Halomicroarcula nitratireducens]